MKKVMADLTLNELTLELISDGTFWCKRNVDFICSNLLTDYFDIPKEAKKLYVKLSRKAAEDRLKIDSISKDESWWRVLYFRNKQEHICVAAYEILEKFGTPCYVEFWWE